MLDYNEIRERKYINFEGEPYEVVASHVARKQQRKPTNQVKMKNLITGRVIEHVYQVSDKAEEADLKKKPVQYIFQNRGEYWFNLPDNPKERFSLSTDVLGSATKYIKEKDVVDALVFNNEDEDKIIGISLPIKVNLAVTECPPNIKGDTATGGNKPATLETGVVVNVPLFINVGDIIKVNTESGEYIERVEKN